VTARAHGCLESAGLRSGCVAAHFESMAGAVKHQVEDTIALICIPNQSQGCHASLGVGVFAPILRENFWSSRRRRGRDFATNSQIEVRVLKEIGESGGSGTGSGGGGLHPDPTPSQEFTPESPLSLSAGLAVLTLARDCIFLRIRAQKFSVQDVLRDKTLWRVKMTDFGTKRQRSSEENVNPTASERTEGTTRRESGGMERASRTGSYGSGIFSVSPGEFFTMSPITLMRRFTEDIDRAFSRFAGNAGRGSGQEDFHWIPAVEVRQSGNNLLIQADLPGLSENDVRLEATEEGLVIEGERKQEHSSQQGGWHHSERMYGHFYRLIPLPENAKVDEAKATFRDGVLEVTVPVSESESKRRQIPIRTGEQGQQSRQESPMTQAANAGQSRTAGSGR